MPNKLAAQYEMQMRIQIRKLDCPPRSLWGPRAKIVIAGNEMLVSWGPEIRNSHDNDNYPGLVAITPRPRQ